MSPESAGRGAAPAEVAFVKYYDKGSTQWSGEQIAAALRERGWKARTIYPREIGGLRDSILVFIKTSRLDHLLRARSLGNRLVLDVHDTVVFKRRIKNRWLYDAMIFKNRRQLADFGRVEKLDRVIYHQWDARYGPNRAPKDRLALAYLGIPRSLELWGRIPGCEFIDADRWFAEAPRFNCHLSIRERGREFLYKPGSKVSTAAVCEANLITTADASAVEFLGDDYPFYCESDLASIEATVGRARAAVGTELWERGLAKLREVRAATRPEKILDDYEALFRDVARRS